MSLDPGVSQEEESEYDEKEWDPIGKYVESYYNTKKSEVKKPDLTWIERVQNDQTFLVLVNETGRTLTKGQQIKRQFG